MNTVKNYTTIYLKLNYRCVESCNSLNDLSNKVCVPNKKEELNLSVFNMITWINESKTKHISCECKCQFDRKKDELQINGGITINVNMSTKNAIYIKKIILESCYMKLQKWWIFIANIMNDSVIMKLQSLDEETKTVPKILMKKI